MKNTLKLNKISIPFLLFFLFFLEINSSLAQEKNTTIYFKNNTKLIGAKGIFFKNDFRFSKEENTKSIKLAYDSIRRIIITDKRGNTKAYEQHKIEGVKKIVFFEILLDGQVSLLKPHPSFGAYGGFFSAIGTNVYFKKNQDKKVTFLYNTNKGPIFVNYKKVILKHFGDCNALVEKLEEKELKSMQVFSVVRFYNKNCFKKP